MVVLFVVHLMVPFDLLESMVLIAVLAVVQELRDFLNTKIECFFLLIVRRCSLIFSYLGLWVGFWVGLVCGEVGRIFD